MTKVEESCTLCLGLTALTLLLRQNTFKTNKPILNLKKNVFVLLRAFPESRLASQLVPDWGVQDLKQKRIVNNFQSHDLHINRHVTRISFLGSSCGNERVLFYHLVVLR